MHLLKSGAKPVPRDKKRRKVPLSEPDIQITLPINDAASSQRESDDEEHKEDGTERQFLKPKRNRMQTEQF